MSTSQVPPSVYLKESKQQDLRALLIAMIALPTVIIILRFWSRYLLPAFSTSHMPTRFWWDDWTALAAVILNIAVCGIGLKLVNLGMGLYIQVVPPESLEPFLKLLWVEYYLFDAGTAVAKALAVFFYARVFGVINSRFKHALWAAHSMNVAWLIGIIFGVIFECSPIEKAWKVILDGTCVNTQTLWLASGITSLLIDVFILLMPLPMLWKLRMKTMRKLQVVGVFICGVVVVSIGRLVTIVQAGTSLQTDPTYQIATPVLWLGSEIAISVTSVSLPSLLFLAQRAIRDGAWSLISTRGGGSRSRLVDTAGSHSHPYSREDNSTELGNPSTEYSATAFLAESICSSHATAIGATGQAHLVPDGRGGRQAVGIHVRNDVVVS